MFFSFFPFNITSYPLRPLSRSLLEVTPPFARPWSAGLVALDPEVASTLEVPSKTMTYERGQF